MRGASRGRRHRLSRAVALAGLLVAGCARVEPARPTATDIDPPAPEGSFAPRLAASERELLLTWWEPVGEPEATGHRLMFSRYDGEWSAPSVVVADRDVFANWADVPSVVREPSGDLLAHWLEKTAAATFAYSIVLARSSDDGASWVELGRLNDDDTDTEHGFVSLVPEDGAVRAFWLDGRGMVDEGPMTVRTARIGASIGESELVDERVCECCPTDAVATSEGAIVVYRDRSEDETREIYSVRRGNDGWSAPAAVTDDGWTIAGCPVNGPAIDHRDGRTAVAWFTGADGAPQVSARFGLTPEAGRPIVIDDAGPVGRVGLTLDADGSAIVSWLAVVDDEAELRLRRLSPDGRVGEALALGRTSGSRASGVPQLGRMGGRLVAAWVEVSEGVESRIRVRQVPSALVPGVSAATPR